jgi:hypothetical protein
VDKLHKTVYLLMAFMLLSAPVVACAVPALAMSDQEKECCHHMSDKCGSTQMDESHTCCTNAPSLGAGTLQPTVKFSTVSPGVLGHVLPAAVDLRTAAIHASAGYRVICCSKSPPGDVSVLRI